MTCRYFCLLCWRFSIESCPTKCPAISEPSSCRTSAEVCRTYTAYFARTAFNIKFCVLSFDIYHQKMLSDPPRVFVPNFVKICPETTEEMGDKSEKCPRLPVSILSLFIVIGFCVFSFDTDFAWIDELLDIETLCDNFSVCYEIHKKEILLTGLIFITLYCSKLNRYFVSKLTQLCWFNSGCSIKNVQGMTHENNLGQGDE